MKTAKRRTVRDVRVTIALFVSAICMAVLGSGIARASDLPPGWTSVYGGPDVPFGQNLAGDGESYQGGVSSGLWEWSYAYNMIVNFNAIDITESGSSSPGYGFPYIYWLWGQAGYTVSVEQESGPPDVDGAPLDQVPVSIEAHAQGSFEGDYGGFSAYADFWSTHGSMATGLIGSDTEAFNVQQTRWMTPGDQIAVSISAFGEVMPSDAGGGGEVSVYVDPTISLDQGAFDAMYPNSGITLSNYYQIDYPSNMSPEPSTFTLLGMGLAVAGYAGRRRKAKA